MAKSKEMERGAQDSTLSLVRDIASDAGALVRKEVELARIEMIDAAKARVPMAIGMGAAAVAALAALVFAGLAVSSAFDRIVPAWASRLIVAGMYMAMATAGLALAAMRQKKAPSLAPQETKRTVKEDVEWAKAQLKR
jgi:protein-S-isoprenylcysteine O-methyltransferase Ste14